MINPRAFIMPIITNINYFSHVMLYGICLGMYILIFSVPYLVPPIDLSNFTILFHA